MFFNLFKTDAEIQKDVTEELNSDPRVTSTQVNVTSDNGIVTLRGSVPHYSEKSLAIQAAQRIGGVKAVADEIDVNLLETFPKSDEDIAAAAYSSLTWNYFTPTGIQIAVEKGWVTLTGEVEWDYQRCAARDAIKPLLGVRGVTNNIVLKKQVQASDVEEKIQSALKRYAENESHAIDVKVENNEVTLSGDVHSFAEMEDARIAAWNAPGVKSVYNNLHISG